MNAIKKIVMGLAVACATATTQAVEIPTVTGSDEVFTNGYDVVHVFKTVGDAALTIADYPATVDILIVGGGGAGGGDAGGGGGGGGVVYLQNQTLTVGAYPLAVGAGGAGKKGIYNGGVGGDSTMMLGETTYVAKGGGGGGYLKAAGSAGGCGGGGGGYGANGPGGASTQELYDGAGHGTAGAAGVSGKNSGGGGGAGAAADGKNGGDGFECWITGEPEHYGAGGGAGYGSGAGGLGGGGAVNKSGTFYGAGGGGASTGGSAIPGSGYQGVVIVRVKDGAAPSAVDATLTGDVFSFDDGLTHSAKLDVGYPRSGWTANWTWNDGTDGHPAPEVFTEPGVYHNSVVVTADELDPFEATAEVSVSIMAPAVGGDAVITNDNYHIIHIFSNVTDAATLKVNRAEVLADILIVGGGGGGGGSAGGGGGGGGVVYLPRQTLTVGEYSLSVGAGGKKVTNTAVGGEGGDSTLTIGATTYTAGGGGGGGVNSIAATAGGCGGGGGYWNKPFAGGVSTQDPYDGAGHGNPGVTGTTGAGGGGGAGAPASGAKGGDGFLCDITGEPVYYGAGGGGYTSGGSGGQGGGGAGSTGNGANGTGYGAGGGGAGSGNNKTSGAGYKGIVVVRLVYAIPPTSVDATVDAPDVPYDGEAHAVTLKVGYPMDAANCTTNWTWEGGSGEVAPTYTEPGIYTNVVRVSAPNLADYVATTTVTIAKINLANAEIDQIPTQDWTGGVIHPTPTVTDKATGLTVSTADFDFVYPTDCTKQGVHTVRIVGKDDVGHAEGEQEVEFVILADSRAVFVAENGSDDNDGRSDTPFATIAHAVALARAAIEHGTESVTIRVKDGTYASPFVTLDIPVAIVGNPEHPENVVITDATASKRAFTLSHADAKVAGVTITGAGYKGANGSGGHILMSLGTVEDCIIEGGRAAANSGAGKGGNVSMSGGCLRRCIVRNGKPADSTTNGNSRGANIHATGGVVENCLVTGGAALTDQTSSFDVSGATKVINCTIVNNTPGSKFGGIHLESDSAQAVNCVIYGNGGTAQKEWGAANAKCFNNCATSADAAFTGGAANIGTVTGESFVNYASGDYTPAAEGALKDAGSKKLYTDSGATSETDLAHAPRFVGILDIGAYEVQPTSLLVQLSAQGNNVAPGVPVTLTATALGASETVSWAWSVNGAGFAAGEATYALDTSVAGVYTVTAKATAGGETAEATHVIRVIAAGSTVDEVWVGQTGDDVNVGVESSPFATIAHAKEFLAAHGAAGTIHLLPGAYFEYGLVLDGAYVVQGEGATRDDVIVSANSLGQAIKLNHANALVENLTVKDGYLNGNGANVYIVLGTVRNCCIRNGATQGNNCGANVYMDNGRLANCQILDGVVCRPGSSAGGTFGAGVYAKGNAVVENCFFKGNYKNKSTSGFSSDNRGCGAVADGSSRIVNCTFVANRSASNAGPTVRINNVNARVVDCVFFDNMPASVTTYTAANSYDTAYPGCFVNCASEVPVPSGNTTCLTGLTANDFKDYANGDYRPAKGDNSILKGAGVTKSEYKGYGAISETDLIGTLWGKTLDIGCYAAKAAGLMLILR